MIIKKDNLRSKLSEWAGDHMLNSYLISVVMLAVAGGLGYFSYLYWPQPPAAQQIEEQPEVVEEDGTTKYVSPLTGVTVTKASTIKRPVTAIMIENSIAARPQSGLKAAGVVFEAIAEGGITRLLTLHQEDRPGMIGPIRSLRPYYVHWLAPFNAPTAHVGGSLLAVRTIRSSGYRDIDEFSNGSSYWRATDRPSPHNVYTSFDRLDKLNKSKGYTSSKFTAWPRKLDSPTEKSKASKINITISSDAFNVRYDYRKSSNTYIRSLGGAPHSDRESGRLAPKTVIVIKVPTHIGQEDGPREQMDTVGFNAAYFFQDGNVVRGFWRKSAIKNQMQFYDKFGREIAFNAGQTWITVIAPSKSVSWR